MTGFKKLQIHLHSVKLVYFLSAGTENYDSRKYRLLISEIIVRIKHKQTNLGGAD
jgi:hypothetical protein